MANLHQQSMNDAPVWGWYPALSEEMDAKVIRLSIELTDSIDGQRLQEACDQAIKYFPHLQFGLKRGFRQYKLEQCFSIQVERETKPLCAPLFFADKVTPLCRVLYYQRRIHVELYMALGDEYVAYGFLQVLVYYYLLLMHPNYQQMGIGSPVQQSFVLQLAKAYHLLDDSHVAEFMPRTEKELTDVDQGTQLFGAELNDDVSRRIHLESMPIMSTDTCKEDTETSIAVSDQQDKTDQLTTNSSEQSGTLPATDQDVLQVYDGKLVESDEVYQQLTDDEVLLPNSVLQKDSVCQTVDDLNDLIKAPLTGQLADKLVDMTNMTTIESNDIELNNYQSMDQADDQADHPADHQHTGYSLDVVKSETLDNQDEAKKILIRTPEVASMFNSVELSDLKQMPHFKQGVNTWPNVPQSPHISMDQSNTDQTSRDDGLLDESLFMNNHLESTQPNPFASILSKFSHLLKFGQRHAYQIKGHLNHTNQCYTIEATFLANHFDQLAQKYGVERICLEAALLIYGIGMDIPASKHEQRIVVDMRGQFDDWNDLASLHQRSDQSIRITYVWNGIPVFENLLYEIDRQLRQEDHMTKDRAVDVNVIQRYRKLPTFIKNSLYRWIDQRQKKQYTATWTDIGFNQMPPELHKYIYQMSFYRKDGAYNIQSIKWGDRLTFTVTSQFAEHRIMRQILSFIARSGIQVTIASNINRKPNIHHFSVLESSLAMTKEDVL